MRNRNWKKAKLVSKIEKPATTAAISFVQKSHLKMFTTWRRSINHKFCQCGNNFACAWLVCVYTRVYTRVFKTMSTSKEEQFSSIKSILRITFYGQNAKQKLSKAVAANTSCLISKLSDFFVHIRELSMICKAPKRKQKNIIVKFVGAFCELDRCIYKKPGLIRAFFLPCLDYSVRLLSKNAHNMRRIFFTCTISQDFFTHLLQNIWL